MTERQIELTWRCSTCRHRNLGRHMECQSCGNPKDDSEEYEMPADPSAVASVEDPNLLRMATAGENWRCAYCGSDQRDLHGACARCGAGRSEGANVAPPRAQFMDHLSPPYVARRTTRTPRLLLAFGGVIAALVGAFAVFAALGLGESRRDRYAAPAVTTAKIPRIDFDGKVTAASWERTITVEKWQLAPHDGFTADVPAGAVDVRAAGQRVHHHEDVFDHDETVYDSVEVPDGYRTETYTTRESCGEDCTTTPRTCRQVCTRTSRSCREVCTNNKNGFASCRDVCTGGDERCRDDCTGGDRRCTTKYCSVTKSRQIPKTRTERRPRIEKKYRSEPRYAAWSTFKTWEWIPARTERSSGDGVEPRWPDAGAPPPAGVAAGAPRPGARREVRAETLQVMIATDDGQTHVYTPSSEEELARLAPGTIVRVRVVGGVVSILQAANDEARDH